GDQYERLQDPEGRPEGQLRGDARPQGQAGEQHPSRLSSQGTPKYLERPDSCPAFFISPPASRSRSPSSSGPCSGVRRIGRQTSAVPLVRPRPERSLAMSNPVHTSADHEYREQA